MPVNFVRRAVLCLFIATAVLIFPFVLRAEDAEKKENKPSQELESSVRYEPKSDARGQSGGVQITKADYLYKYDFKAFDKLPVEVSLYNRYTGINSSVSEVRFPAKLIELATGIETTVPFFNLNKTYFRLGVAPSFYSDTWDFPSSSFRIPSHYYAIYQPNPKLTLLGGVYVFPDTQNPVFPILGFIYNPNEKLSFNIVPPRPNITYALTDKISVFGEGSFSIDNEYEVKFDSTRTAVIRYYETYLGAGIGYKPNKFIKASLSVGGSFRRRLTYDDSLGKVNIKDGMYTALRVTVTP